MLCAVQARASTYYVSSSEGDDSNDGQSTASPFKSIDHLNGMAFAAGDSILFQSGGYWEGMFWIHGTGSVEERIVVGKYGGDARPVINGFGYQSCLLVYNDSYIDVQDLELFNEASHLDVQGLVKKLDGFAGESNDWGSGKNVRFGIKVVADTQSIEGFRFSNLYVHDVFPTPTAVENAHKGYGVKIETHSDLAIDAVHLAHDVYFSGLSVARTGHYGIWIKSLGLSQNDLFKNQFITMESCDFDNTGGAGFVPNKSEFVLVEHCTFDHTGSSVDSRMWKRGSGMWPFDCRNLISQYNHFMNAHGPIDSYGAHIDYGNENVVFQYNLSYNNEGGFVEILGDNIHCGYRYNISINDGYRIDPDGVHNGRTYNISDYCGNNGGCPSVGTFIYNNTIFIGDTIHPEIRIKPEIGELHCYNNLLFCTPDGDELPCIVGAEGNELNFSHNLYFDANRMNLVDAITANALFGDPTLTGQENLGSVNPEGYRIGLGSPAFESGLFPSDVLAPNSFFDHDDVSGFFGDGFDLGLQPSIGAHQPLSGSFYCGNDTFWNPLSSTCTACSCAGDFNYDGVLNVSDLLVFFTLYGNY
jgi:hypothetical protein